MKKHYCIFILLLCCRISFAQNLVPNPSFEEHIGCPTTLNDYDFTYWDAFRGTPDYYNTCSSNIGFNNPFGFQIAHSGFAYAGIISFITNTIPIWREHLGVPLLAPLQIGQTYYVSFYVSRAFKQPAHDMASNKIGALFSTVLYDDTLNPSPISNFAHVYEDSIITDTTNWVHLHWSFTADAAYQYLIIGNFFDDANTDTIMMNQFSHDAIYYIDDVCVSTDSLCNSSDIGINDPTSDAAINFFPNPFTTQLNIAAQNNEALQVFLYDILGRQLYQQSFTGSTTINTQALASGMYICEVRNKNGVVAKGKVVRE